MGRLKAQGVLLLALTNGSRSDTRSLLERSGLRDFIEHIVSVDDVEAWKPKAEVYLRAAAEAGVEPSALALIAAHAWDCQGAARAGLVTGWVSRPERRFNPALGRPDVRGETLTDVAGEILRLADG